MDGFKQVTKVICDGCGDELPQKTVTFSDERRQWEVRVRAHLCPAIATGNPKDVVLPAPTDPLRWQADQVVMRMRAWPATGDKDAFSAKTVCGLFEAAIDVILKLQGHIELAERRAR